MESGIRRLATRRSLLEKGPITRKLVQITVKAAFATESEDRLLEPKRQRSWFDWLALLISSLSLLYGSSAYSPRVAQCLFRKNGHTVFLWSPSMESRRCGTAWVGSGWEFSPIFP